MSKHSISASVSAGVAFLSILGVGSAHAVEPHYVKLTDSMIFVPGLQLKESFDDNIHADQDNEQSSWVTTLTPSFTLAGQGSKSSYLLNYTASHDSFHSSSDDDNTDQSLLAQVNLDFTARQRLQLTGGYGYNENVVTRNQAQQNNRSELSYAEGVYTYGARTARGQLDLAARREALRYDNSSGLNRDNERDSTTLRSTLYYRVAPQTKLLLELRQTEHDYLVSTEDSSTNYDLLTGITWEATAKTSGTVKFGRGQKRYDDSSRDSASTGVWEAGITWAPRSYSTVTFNTRRSFDESSEATLADGDVDLLSSDGGAVKTQAYTLGWKHYWQQHLFSQIGYAYNERDYLDTGRLDEYTAYNVGLTYEARRWLDVGLGYQYSTGDSTVASEEFERNVYSLNFKFSL